MDERRPPPTGLRAALITGLIALPVAMLVVLAALALALRHGLAADGTALARRAAALSATPPTNVTDARRLVLRSRVPARVRAPGGAILAESGPGAAWTAAASPLATRIATMGVDGWTARSGWMAAERPLGAGGRLELRAPLAPGADRLGVVTVAAALAGAALLALLAALAAGTASRRVQRRARRAALAAESLATGRPLPGGPAPPPGEWRHLDEELCRAAGRIGELQGEAALELGGIGTVIGPLPLPVAVRTPTGGRVRNDALIRLAASLTGDDLAALEDAVRTGLEATGAVARRLEPADGRVLEVESWSLPGGRLVALAERTEQHRLARLREGLSGAAARHLRGPVREIQTATADLYARVPAPLAPGVQRVSAAADRLDRLVARLLRGSDHDPAGRPSRREAVGAAGLLFGVANRWDRILAGRALRIEVDAALDLPPLWTDPRLAEEVLDQLVENAAAYTPRGGTVVLAASSGPECVVLEVRDSGGGLAPDEVAHVREAFYRGRAADALPGAGLGLGVAAALVDRLAGRLELAPGPGGNARVELPAASRAPGEDTARRPALTASGSAPG